MRCRNYVFCPGFSGSYDTDIQLEDMKDVVEYAYICDVEYFAILDDCTLEYYGRFDVN